MTRHRFWSNAVPWRHARHARRARMARAMAGGVACLALAGVVCAGWAGAALAQAVTDPAAGGQPVLARFFGNLAERPWGPMSFRFLLQPVMASLAALRDGRQDAQTGRAPYFWTVLTNGTERRGRVVEGLRATGRVMALGLIMDLIYQGMVFGTFYPMEAVTMALLLGFVPYLILRGPAARVFRSRKGV